MPKLRPHLDSIHAPSRNQDDPRDSPREQDQESSSPKRTRSRNKIERANDLGEDKIKRAIERARENKIERAIKRARENKIERAIKRARENKIERAMTFERTRSREPMTNSIWKYHGQPEVPLKAAPIWLPRTVSPPHPSAQ
ncbi:hypothetical protein BD769DRAFT_1386240 [Suillus cothurnatus]|nr:hypothetical protein BD769DRAFT_1386240 [Suillus cothurnatus]